MLRLKQLSFQAEKTYLHWVRSFYRFLNGASPFSINDSNVKEFLTYLAVEKHVSASTQNQAFNAILFLFRHVIDKEIDGLNDVVIFSKFINKDFDF